MPAALTIGDFSRATHLSVKTLRHYHRVGLLAPADVDRDTGYRRYTTDQIPTAQVIRRFRDLDMPLDQIQAVLEAPDLRTRNELISAHLASLERNLARTQSAVASLRGLLASPSAVAPVSHRWVGETTAAAVTAARPSASNSAARSAGTRPTSRPTSRRGTAATPGRWSPPWASSTRVPTPASRAPRSLAGSASLTPSM